MRYFIAKYDPMDVALRTDSNGTLWAVQILKRELTMRKGDLVPHFYYSGKARQLVESARSGKLRPTGPTTNVEDVQQKYLSDIVSGMVDTPIPFLD